MFRITFMIHEDSLVDIIKKVAPVAINLNVTDTGTGTGTPAKAVTKPVPKAVTKEEPLANGALKTKGVQSLDRIINSMREHNITSFKASMFKEILKRADLNPISYGHYLKELVKYGCLSKLGRGTSLTYQLTDRS